MLTILKAHSDCRLMLTDLVNRMDATFSNLQSVSIADPVAAGLVEVSNKRALHPDMRCEGWLGIHGYVASAGSFPPMI